MFKKFSNTTRLFGGLIALVCVIMVILIASSGNKASSVQTHYVNDNASADNKVEALKTLTANLINVENNNKQLQQQVKQLQTDNKNVITDLKKSVSDQMQSALQTIQNQNQQTQRELGQTLQGKWEAKEKTYPIRGAGHENAFIWVSDLSKSIPKNAVSSGASKDYGLFDRRSETDSVLHTNDNDSLSQKNTQKKKTTKPIYTLPTNATLTGATLMTPLVGRVPIDGRLPSPYHFKLVLSATNLTANGYPLPGIKGAVMSGIASGDMLGRCVRGDIHSMTFIFNDGTISTTQVQGDNQSLGYLSSQTGNPCIAGTFHSNAVIFLGAQMGLAGAEGYANALASSQYLHASTPEGGSISTLIGSANKAGLGEGMSAASQAAQTWWNRRVQNSFDYVYVSNVNSKTGKPMKVVVNITQQIPINYNPTARKVSYENVLQTHQRHLD